MTFPYGQDIVLHRRVKVGTDAYNVDTWTVTDDIVRGAFAPGPTSEPDRDATALSQPAVYLPSGTDVSYVDTVTVAGATYEVDGQPGEWVNPFTGWHPGVEVRLKRTLRGVA